MYYTCKYIKKSYKKHELPDGLYSISDIQNCFEYIQKNYLNLSIRIYLDEIEKRNPFKIKTGYYFKLLTPVTIKLIGSTKSKITKSENGGNVPC